MELDDPKPPLDSGEAARRVLLSQHPFFRKAAPETLGRLIERSLLCSFGDGEAIFRKGDPGEGLYGVLSGSVRISTETLDGRAFVLSIVRPGEIFGEIALLDGGARTAHADAMGRTELFQVRRSAFKPLLTEDPGLCGELIELLCRRLRWTNGMVEDSALLDLPTRLAKRLLLLARTHGRRVEGGTRITARLTQEEIAELMGVTREAVDLLFAKWRAEGMIQTSDGWLVVTDMSLLASVAVEPGEGD